MRFLLTGGGTGGHVFPALAVAERVQARWPEARILFVGTRAGLEASVVPQAGHRIVFVHARGLAGSPLSKASAVVHNAIGVAEAICLVKRFRPTVVVGSGGYVSLPVGLAATWMGVPTVLLEQNVVPGKTTKLLAGRAARVCVSFEDTQLDGANVVVTGNPVRGEILTRTRSEGRKAMGVPDDAFCLLVTGASQGARTVNEAVVAALPRWKDRPWHVLHLTGRLDHDSVVSRARPAVEGGALTWDGRAFEFDMASAYAAADLVVARAGATSMAEITCRGLPAVLIPYPHAAAHQVDNARWLEQRGGAVTVLNERAVADLPEVVEALAGDGPRRAAMSDASRAASHPDAADRIAAEVAAVTGAPVV